MARREALVAAVDDCKKRPSYQDGKPNNKPNSKPGERVNGDIMKAMKAGDMIETIKASDTTNPINAITVRNAAGWPAKRCCVFLADLHLSCDQREKWQYLLRWLAQLPGQVERLYILGDLFKYWLGDDYHDEMTEALAAALSRLNERIPVVLLRGNRDYLLGAGFAGAAVCLPEDGCVVDLYGRPTMLLHGDRLCSRDWRYRFFRAAADNWVSRAIFASLPISWRDWIARAVQGGLPHKSAADVWIDEIWLRRQLGQRRASQVIYGHFHCGWMRECMYERTREHVPKLAGSAQLPELACRVSGVGDDDGRAGNIGNTCASDWCGDACYYREICLSSWDGKPSWLVYDCDHQVYFADGCI